MPLPLSDAARARVLLLERRRRRYFVLGAVLSALLALTALWRIARGQWHIPFPRVFRLLSPFLPEAERLSPDGLIVRSVRLPRFFAAVGSGGLLAAAGAVLQGLLANPLAEPYTLGIAAGAAFGGSLAFFFTELAVVPAAFAGAAGALAISCFVARAAFRRHGSGVETLVLAGIITNAVLSAGVTFLKAVAGDRLDAVVLWLMGSFAGASPRGALLVWLGALVVLAAAWFDGRALDAVSLGERQGEMLGVNERALRFRLLSACSLGVALSVSHFGIIGFVGLAAPHIVRGLLGPLHRPLVVFSFLAGGLLLALADGAAQFLGELPAGVVTAVLAGPFFCWLLVRRK